MKKIYVAAALGLAVTASAFALPTRNVKAVDFSGKMEKIQLNAAEFGGNSDMMKAPAKSAVTADKLVGMYRHYSQNAVEGAQPTWNSLEITPGADANTVVMTGFLWGFPATGKLNPQTGEIAIGEQPMFFNSYYNEDVYLYPTRWNDAGEGMIDIESVVFTYMASGVSAEIAAQLNVEEGWLPGGIFTDPYDVLTFSTPSLRAENRGFGWYYVNILQPMDSYFGDYDGGMFKYVDSDWADCGTAQFEDGFLACLNGVYTSPAYSVKCKKSNVQGGLVMLYQPYNASSPYADINAGDGNGYIVLNIQNTDCVLVRPNVYSGFTTSDAIGEGKIFLTNAEGNDFYLAGYGYDEIIEAAEYFGDPISTMTSDGVVSIPTGRYSPVYDVLAYQQWTDADENAIPMASVVRLPAEALSGVEGIIMDINNAANEYFNLQGVRINNPERGQIVIVKNGNKSTKVVL